MGLLQKIRQKPEEQKIRIIWIICGIVIVLFLVLWGLTTQIGKGAKPDTSFFKTLNQGFKDLGAELKNR